MTAAMPDILFGLTAALYLVASVLFAFHLAGSAAGSKAMTTAPRLLLVAVVLHTVQISVASLAAHVCPVAGIHFALSIVALLLCVLYLGVRRVFRLDAVGAFVAPFALTFLLAARFVGLPGAVREPSAGLTKAVLPVHVLANVVGEALFMLASAAAVLYLLQESRLKQKKLEGVFQRLPPLDALDRAEHRFLLAGFPLLTLGILTGTVWAHKVEQGHAADVWRALFGYVSWLLFAAVLLLRAAAGWRGRRAAYGTIAGFGFALLVLLVYLLRSTATTAVGTLEMGS